MKEFCESSGLIEEDQDYELFSVVIHGYVTVCLWLITHLKHALLLVL